MTTPGPLSVYRFCSAVIDAASGKRYLTDPAPFTYRVLEDTIEHVAQDGDTWWTVAATYYAGIRGISHGALLWRVVAEFQPIPPVDPSVPPERGQVLYVPSERTLLELVFSETRRPEYEA